MADILTWQDIAARLSERGRGAKNQLAKRLGLDPSDLSRRLKRSGEPTASQAKIVQDFLDDVPEGESASFQPTAHDGGRRLPVFGYAAAGGEDNVALASNQVLDYVDVPAGLVRGEAFVVRLVGESMYPRLRSGESVVVEVGVAPHRYDDVLVELNDGTGLVKEYRGQRDGYLFLFQHNPEKELKVPLTKVSRMHAAWPWRRR